MKEIHDHSMSWPRHSMQEPVLPRLGAIQPPGHHFFVVVFRAGMEISLFNHQRDCQDDSEPWMAREHFLQEAVRSWLHLFRDDNTITHNFHYFLVLSGVYSWSNHWGYTLKPMREPVAELGWTQGCSALAPTLSLCCSAGGLVLRVFNIRCVLSPGFSSRTHVLNHPLHLGCTYFP